MRTQRPIQMRAPTLRAIIAAIGMSVVAVLVLRALGEWKEIERRERDERRSAGM